MGDPVSLVVTPMIDALIQNTSSLIKEEYRLVSGVKQDIEKLSSNLTTIRAVLEDAEEKQLTDAPVKDWLRKLKDAAFDAEDILDTFKTEAYLWQRKQQARRFRCPLSTSKVSFRRDAAHKIKEISARLDEIAKEKQNFHLDIKVDSAGSAGTRDRPHTSFFLDTSEVVGREVDKEKIIDLLLSNEDGEDLSVVPIIGMGGLGKTTLAQLAFNDGRIKDHFKFKMWVCVTVDFNLKRILKEMMEYYSEMKFDINLSISQLHSRLLEFMKGKRFLLVLDDVWIENYAQWESLQGLLRQGGAGSKVLVTSRTAQVSDVMGTNPPYRLSYLPEEECWSLFKRIAFKNTGHSSSGVQEDLEDIGRRIVHKCDGLPLAVKAMGGLLRGNLDVSKWQKILENDIWEVEKQNSRIEILPALKLSYDHLPSHLKQCFAYCSIYPKAYVFDKNVLIQVWMALAYIQSRGRDRLEDIGNDYFDELLVRSFFQLSKVDNEDRYKMHDLIHDLAQSISSPDCFQVKDNSPPSAAAQNTRHLSLLCKDVEKPTMKIIGESKKLRTLLLPSDYLKDFGQALNKLFRTLRYMRVLDLSSSTILEVPESIQELKLLCYLDLSKTQIQMLPDSICNLSNLQTLRLLRCLWLFKLPNNLGNLTNLRHLEIDEMFWHKLSTLPQGLGSLTSLHNFPFFQVGHEKGYGIDELKNMGYLTGVLHISKLENVVDAREAELMEKERLRKVVLEWSKDVDTKDEISQERVIKDLQPHPNTEELQILYYRGSRFPPWLSDGLLRNLVSLSLNNCIKCSLLSLSQVPRLGQLYIKDMQELEELEAQCPSLHTLKISNCSKLKELPNIFPNLRVLKIKRCESLKALPIAPSMAFLILLENPILEDWCEVMVRRVYTNDQGQFEAKIQPSFLNLLELKITGCPQLKALPNIFAPQKLEISGCESLRALPVPQHAQRLQHLALDSCLDETLVRAIPSTGSLYSLVISDISGLISLPKLPHLPGLTTLYIRNCKDLISLSEGQEEEGSLRSLTALKLLSIQGCPKLVTLPSKGLPAALESLSIGSCPNLKSLGPSGMLKGLNSLNDLYIEHCPALESLPDGGLPTSLQHLLIQGCPLVMERCQKENGGPDWPKIMNIPDVEIVNIHDVAIDSSAKNSSAKQKRSSSTWLRLVQGKKGKKVAVDPHNGEVFLDHKRKKKWVDPRSGNICFLLYARSLFITWGSREYWTWNCFKETDEENIEVAKLTHICWLDVRGKFEISELPNGVVYEIAYLVKVTNGGSGWELPIKLRLSLPDGKVQERQVSLLDKPRGQWFELSVGNFLTREGEIGDVCFDLFEHGGHWKIGLIVKGVIMRPKVMTT